MWLSLPVRLTLTVVALLAVTVSLTLSVSHRVAVDTLAEQRDRGAQGLFSTLSVSHAGEVLGLRSEDVAEMRRAAQRLVTDGTTGVRALAFHDARGEVVVEAHADDARPLPGLASLPPALDESAAPEGARRWAGPVLFGGRAVGAITLETRDDLALRLKPRLGEANLLLGLVVTVLGGLLVLFVSRRSLSAVPALSRAIEQVRQADFSARVPETGAHELRHLAGAFNEMSRRLELFGQYTNPALIRALIQDPDLAGPGGVLRHVTVVFSDMRGFTRMSASRPPADVLRQVNLYFHLFERIVLDHGGHIDKYMGDAMMAVFGLFDSPLPDLHRRLTDNLPVPYSQQAVRAMLRARDAVRVVNRYLETAGPGAALTPEVFGCGIASGHATAGNLGGEKKKDYSVVGNIVNLAARLESQSRKGEVLIDSHTRRNLGPGGVVAPRPPVDLKGFDRPVVPYEVLSLEAGPHADVAELRSYLRGVFTEAFVHRALLRGDALVTADDVRSATARLHAILDAYEPVSGLVGQETGGTG